MNVRFPKYKPDETESLWFKLAHAAVGLLVFIALVMLAISSWDARVADLAFPAIDASIVA
jgi:hypothetical protein